MKLFFAGTAACDWDWSKYGQDDCWGTCSTLLNDTVLIDAGYTGYRALEHWKVNLGRIREIWFTHSHADHCFAPEIAQILTRRPLKNGPLFLRGSNLLLQKLKRELQKILGREKLARTAEFGVLRPMREVELTIAGKKWKVMPVPGNHATEILDEIPLHYIITHAGKSLLYALDGAWMTARARNALNGLHLDCVVWDATVEKSGDWRFCEHNDMTMVQALVAGLKDAKIVDNKTVHVADHIAHVLWSPALKVPKPFIRAISGNTLEI